jgi:hypothetical protein
MSAHPKLSDNETYSGGEWLLRETPQGSLVILTKEGLPAGQSFMETIFHEDVAGSEPAFLRVEREALTPVRMSLEAELLKPAYSSHTLGRSDNETRQAWEALRDKGRRRAAELLLDESMVTAEQLAERLGVSKQTVHNRHQNKELIGLSGAKRGVRFPLDQLDRNDKPYAEIKQLFALIGGDGWALYHFLNQQNGALGGQSGFAALRDGRGRDVLRAAETVARGHFG